jgi:hypothetical protein
MRQPAIAFTALLATTFAMTSVVYADEQADKQAIIEASRTLDDGLQRKNLNQAFSIHAPEFTQVDMDGKVRNLEQIRKDTQQLFQKIRQVRVIREQQITINGQTATEVGTAYQTIIWPNPNNPQVPIPVFTVFQYQSTWKRTNSGWKATNARTFQSNDVGGQQSSQVNRRKLTPAQEQIEIMKYQQMMRFNNNATCMMTGFSCGF